MKQDRTLISLAPYQDWMIRDFIARTHSSIPEAPDRVIPLKSQGMPGSLDSDTPSSEWYGERT